MPAPAPPTPAARASTLADYHARVARAISHIRRHLDSDLPPHELARTAAFSPHHFQKVFHGMVGEPITAFVRRLRLERAANELRASRRHIPLIAADAGYTTEAFTRAFRAHFGLPPAAYRDLPDKPPHPPVPSAIHHDSPPDQPPRFLMHQDLRMLHNIRTLARPAIPLAAVRHVGPYTQIGAAFQTLAAWADRRGLATPDTLRIGVYHDDAHSVPAHQLRADAAISVPPGFALDPARDPGIALLTLPAGDYLVGTHHGHYSGLDDAYAWFLGQWMPANDHEPADSPCYEIYLNSCEDTPEPDLRTDIHIPLQIHT